MEYNVRIHKGNNVSDVRAEEGIRLLDFLRGNSIKVGSPCGGSGTCGKCRIKVNGLKSEPSGKEKSLLGNRDIEMGIRLACYNRIEGDLEIFADESSEKALIVTEGVKRNIHLDPLLNKEYKVLAEPQLHDQASDLERVLSLADGAGCGIDMDMLRKLPEILRSSDFKATFIYSDGQLISVEPGNTVGRHFGAAFDIGTTTIAAYLYDLNTGEHKDTYSILNPQRKYGADVLSRIEYTIAEMNGLDSMNNEIIKCINLILGQFAEKNELKLEEIYTVTFAGNTTMMHFLMKMDARNIAVAPFIPVTTSLHIVNGIEMGININAMGKVVFIPGVSGYIGADTVAAVLSSGMYEDKKISLLIDIGTNGEIVLGNNEWLYSCSTAAGPAFEGANIRNGVGGITGAISSVKLVPELDIKTIGNTKPIGICGSGIVDAIAGMLSAGLIDETGRLADEEEAESLKESYRKRLVELEGKRAFLLVEASGRENDIAITQKDIRELQNAKAAIAAGIKTLVKFAGISLDDVESVYLAGGFGSFIDIESAIGIGLLPKELKGRIKSIGNAAGSGAVEVLLSKKMLAETGKIKARIKNVELSASAEFVDEYVECMMFE